MTIRRRLKYMHKRLGPYYVVGAFAALLFAIFVANGLSQREDVPASLSVPLAREMHAGDLAGAIVVLQYFDLECPSCREYAVAGEPYLSRMYADAPVAFAYRHLPLSYLHPGAAMKAEALECAALQQPKEYKALMSAIYQHGGGATTTLLGDLVGQFALDARSMRACVEEGSMRPLVRAGSQSATLQGVYMTPTFVVYMDGKERARIDGYRIRQLQTSIDLLLAERADDV